MRSLETEIQALIGNVRIMFATKKCSSIGNSVVRNKQLSFPNVALVNQRCNVGGCLQCPLTTTETSITINSKQIRIPKNLNCKSRHVIYLWLCKLCAEEAYFGRTRLKNVTIEQVAIEAPSLKTSGRNQRWQCMLKTYIKVNFP